MTSKQEITGLVLCGGAGRRIGGQDKGLAPFRGTPLVEHVIKRLQPQVGQIILSANRNLSRYQTWGFPVFPDTDCSGQGPLSGILTGLLRCDSPCLAIVPCDAPFLPGDLVTRLCGALLQQRADVALAHDGARLQPTFCLITRKALPSLNQALRKKNRKLERWLLSLENVVVDFSDQPQGFVNLNHPEDFLHWEQQ